MMIKPFILYIDDEAINLMLFSNIFKRKYDIQTATSGMQGLEILQQNNQINVVICDMKMPGMDGLSFVKKARLLYPQVHFFILTGFEISEEIETALNEGIILDYFQKPFNMESIDQAIVSRLNP